MTEALKAAKVTNVTKSFWQKFASLHWEKKPLLARGFRSPLSEIDAERVFRMLVEYADRCRDLHSPEGFKFYVEGELRAGEEVLELLPLAEDESLEGYHARMEEAFDDYCLVCDELLQASHPDWARLGEFTDALFAHVGFPHRFVEMGLYLGNYRKTPFGVHVDACGVFSFPVIGRKTFRLWKPAFVEKNPALDRAHEYDEYKKNSTTLTASAGDMTYWPSSAWHIAESDGSFSATWSLGVWVDRTHESIVEDSLRPLLSRKIGNRASRSLTRTTSRRPDGEVRSLPKDLESSTEVLAKLSKNDLHDAFMIDWLKLRSKDGFKTAPHFRAKRALSNRDRIRLENPHRLYWSKLKTRAVVAIAFQGHLIESPVSSRLLNLLRDLNQGRECLISDYVSSARDCKTVRDLSKLGAFV